MCQSDSKATHMFTAPPPIWTTNAFVFSTSQFTWGISCQKHNPYLWPFASAHINLRIKRVISSYIKLGSCILAKGHLDTISSTTAFDFQTYAMRMAIQLQYNSQLGNEYWNYLTPTTAHTTMNTILILLLIMWRRNQYPWSVKKRSIASTS